MAFFDYVLEPPSYGWSDEKGELVKPSSSTIFKEFFSRINVFKTRKNWLALCSWLWALAMLPFLIVFLIYYFSWPLLALAFVYSMIFMGSHGTVWYHRYATHRAFKFRNTFWRFLTQNLVIKVIPEEAYVVSHHVHHVKSDEPGDPYNTFAGWLYCFLADANHQAIARDLDEKDYIKASNLIKETCVRRNTYSQYLKWGSIAHPFWMNMHVILNWTFWYTTFFLIGGHALACALFGSAHIWALGVRTFNYEGHGKGKDQRREGVDFNWRDHSINQAWPGFVAGEWHNNHHLYPNSARNGFTRFQVDFPWYYIYLLSKLGGVSEYKNSTREFKAKYYLPYLEEKKRRRKQQTINT